MNNIGKPFSDLPKLYPNLFQIIFKKDLVVIWENYFKLISKKAIMTTRITNRGTSVLNHETCPPNSAGALYQKCQEYDMASLPPETVISTKRGTSRMKASDYPKVESNLPNWGFITTARGTSRRRR